MQNTPFKKGEHILFIGDSVTDCGRDRTDPASLGSGYPSLVAAYLWAHYPHLDLRIRNQGVSGDRVYDLERRWQTDCIGLKPDWLSVLIGINDTWRRFDSNVISAIDDFHKTYHKILSEVVKETGTRLILCDPFVLAHPRDRLLWREDLNPRIDVVRQLALEFSAIYVPLDGVFAAASAVKAPAFWAEDGVHPSLAGHGLIAKTWLGALGIQKGPISKQ